MIARLTKKIAIPIICLCLLSAAGYAEGARDPITIAIPPCDDILKTFENFQPLARYLKQELGQDINIFIPKSFVEFKRALSKGNVDFAFQSPHIYLESIPLFNRDALLKALTLDGKSSRRGVVIARKDSGIRKIEDLKGKVMIFGPELSTIKWTGVKSLLEKNGLNIEKDLKDYSHGECCDSIALNIYLKAADAGTICEHTFEEMLKKGGKGGMDPQQLTIIGKTPLYLTWVFAPLNETDIKTVTALNAALLRLNKENPGHKAILESAEIGGFVEAKDEEYVCLRDTLRQTPMPLQGATKDENILFSEQKGE